MVIGYFDVLIKERKKEFMGCYLLDNKKCKYNKLLII